jgi:predicted DCC family thiol-disulfide oxidoreductase YuxK
MLGLESPEAAWLLAGVPEERRAETLRLVRPDGTVVAGGDAALAALGAVRATRPLRRALAAAGAERLARDAYERVARNRERLGRFLPDGTAPRRFP